MTLVRLRALVSEVFGVIGCGFGSRGVVLLRARDETIQWEELLVLFGVRSVAIFF